MNSRRNKALQILARIMQDSKMQEKPVGHPERDLYEDRREKRNEKFRKDFLTNISKNNRGPY